MRSTRHMLFKGFNFIIASVIASFCIFMIFLLFSCTDGDSGMQQNVYIAGYCEDNDGKRIPGYWIHEEWNPYSSYAAGTAAESASLKQKNT